MSANSGSTGGGTERSDRSHSARRAGTTTAAAETSPRLVSTLVTDTNGADRRTVYPPGLSSVARMSTWLTADDDAFVDLSAMR